MVPELAQELTVWTEGKPIFDQLQSLESRLSNTYKDLDSNAKEKPHVDDIIAEIRVLAVTFSCHLPLKLLYLC